MGDYRCTKYCNTFDGILKKRAEYKDKFVKEHPSSTHHYNTISKKDGSEKKDFVALFGEKCVYCGTSLSIISLDLFEIDHFIPKAHFPEDKYIEADCIDNLVPSCQACNRNKSDFLFGNDNNIINVESGINQIFYRDENFYIKIAETYKNDPKICDFYSKMKFDSELRRIDYLLMSLEGLSKKSSKFRMELTAIFNSLLQKRNRYSSFCKNLGK